MKRVWDQGRTLLEIVWIGSPFRPLHFKRSSNEYLQDGLQPTKAFLLVMIVIYVYGLNEMFTFEDLKRIYSAFKSTKYENLTDMKYKI